jgi:hypothetical protein
MVVFPRANVDMRYDSNVYNRPDADNDVVVVARSGVRLTSDLSRHAFQVDGAAEGRRYSENSGENSNQWSLAANARLDLAQRITAGFDAGLARRIERRGTFGDLFLTDKPVSFHERRIGANIARTGGIVELQASIATRRLTYNDARVDKARVDQSFRDVNNDTASVRVEYRGFTRFGLFTRMTARRLRYEQGPERNSKGFSVVAGATYRLNDLLSIEAGAGFIRQDARNNGEGKFNSFDYSISADWTPTPRLRLTLQGERSVERSPIPTAISVLQSTLEGGASLAIGRSTLLELDAGMVRNTFDGIDRRETRVFAQLTARRRITSRLAGLVGVSGRRQSGSGLGHRTYDGAAVRIGINFAF